MIHTGDCLDVLPTLAPESIDAIVTDPPYGLEFMGKEWDRLGESSNPSGPQSEGWHDNGGRNPYARRATPRYAGKLLGNKADEMRRQQEWHYRWAVEAFRVAKPGAHLLAFGGTRTYHRLACAIEDAGWEVRDTLCWGYASGFPKSLNVGKDERFCHCEPPTEHDLRPLRDGDVPEAEPTAGRSGTVLLAPLPLDRGTPGADAAGRLPWSEEPSLEGWRDPQEAEGELRRGAPRSGASVGASNGSGGRVHRRASAGDGRVGGAAPVALGDGKPRQPQSVGQPAGEPRPLADEWRSQAGRGWPRCARCGKPQVSGWGTALKPAWEPIILARKPLRGTVARNVQEYGTGALNIDGCRVGTEDEPLIVRAKAQPGDVGTLSQGPRPAGEIASANPSGRWPANVILTDPIFDGDVPGVVGGGEQSGGGNPRWRSAEALDGSYHGNFGGGDTGLEPFDTSGTYSRFFLVAKAARSDREPVLGGLEPRQEKAHRRTGIVDNPRLRGETWRQNHHPTVKPTELMRHLVRLVTPPGGTVLDPFLGSGTTAIACELEGFAWVGIEREASYVEIAEARLNGTQKGLGL